LTAAGLSASLAAGAAIMNAPCPPISLVSLEPEAPPGIPSQDTHKLMVEVALADHRLDSNESALIQAVRQSGTLSATEAEEIEKAVRKDLKVGPQNAEETTYYKALQSAHGDDILTTGDVDLLGKMQLAVGLSDERVAQLLQTLPKQAQLEAAPEPAPTPKSTPDGYRVLVRTALMDRHIDSNEQTMLKQIAESDNLTSDATAEVIMIVKKELGIGPQDDPERTYFTVLKTARSDGDLSATEEAMLQSMQTSLNLTGERVTALKQDAVLLTPPKVAEPVQPAATKEIGEEKKPAEPASPPAKTAETKEAPQSEESPESEK
jgi:tellurite resistance protein